MNKKPSYEDLEVRVRELEDELSQRTAELREARDLYRLLIETIPHAVQELSPDGTIRFANPAHHRIYGYEEGELVGRSVFEMVPGDRERERLVDDIRLIVTEQPPPTPWLGKGVTKQGHIFDVQTDWNYVRSEDGRLRGLVAVVTDITERRNYELALLRARDELEARVRQRTAELEEAKEALERDMEARRRAERERDHLESKLRRAQTLEAVGRLAGGVAHDFNNLLGSLLGCLYTARGCAGDHRQVAAELEAAQDLCRQGGDLTRKLLTVACRRPGLWEVTDVAGLFREIQPLLERSLSKDVHLAVELDPGLPPIRVDRSRFTGALLNLAWNANDAMPDGGDLVFRASATAQEGRSARVLIEVADTGPGIPPEARDRIFEPFFTTKEPGRGHGLGLSITYATVGDHGGEITVHADDRGSTFRILLPATAPAAAGHLDEPAARSAVPVWDRPVLVVEDEPKIARLLVDSLNRHGYPTLFTGDGLEALETLRTRGGEIGLVLLDLALPGVSGEKVYRILRMSAPHLPVLIVTGRGERARALDPDLPCLLKPFTEGELLDAVERLLGTA